MFRNTLIATVVLALTPVLAIAAPVTGVKTTTPSAMAAPAKTDTVKPMTAKPIVGKTVKHHTVKKQAVSTHLKTVKPALTKS